MNSIIEERMTARMDGSFVVFLIGMRVNKLWQVNKWMPVAMAMPRMIRELEQKPDAGFLGYEQWLGRTTMMVQYWESFEKLDQYARNRDSEHYPAWMDFNKKVRKSGAVGIWHEAYLIPEGQHESIYQHMPPFGLGKVGRLIPTKGIYQSARDRIGNAKPLKTDEEDILPV